MAKRRAGVSAGKSAVSWAGKAIGRALMKQPDLPLGRPRAVPYPPRRLVFHPAIPSTHHSWYRVIRILRTHDALLPAETIGEFPALAPAMTCCETEIGHARVLDRAGKIVTTNGRPLETRTEDADHDQSRGQ